MSAPTSLVARSLARAYAAILLMDGGQQHPSSRLIDTAARTIPTSCSAPQDNQYPCSVQPPNKTPPVQACTAAANAAGDVGIDGLRCGDRSRPFPIVRPAYVDCARIGHVVVIHGTARTFKPVPTDDRDDARADLTGVRVAANPLQLCWDFETAAPPAVGEQLSLGVGDASAGLDFDSPDGPSAQDGPSAITAQVGSSGKWTSLLVTAADLDPSVHDFPSHFSFVASAEWNNTEIGTKHASGEDSIHGQYP